MRALAITLALLLAAPAALGASPGELGLREQIGDFVRALVPGTVSRVEMPSLQRFSIAARGLDVRVELREAGRSSRPDRVPVTVSLWDEQSDRLLKRGTVNVDVEGERPVVVAGRALRPGTRLTRDDLEVEMRPLSELGAHTVDDASSLIGQRMRRAVARGAVMQRGFAEEPPLVERGQRVKIRVASGALRIEMVGVAKQEGRAGEWIRATNERSQREVIGRLAKDGTIHVDL